VFLVPIALFFAVRWALLVPCAELEELKGLRALRRSGLLVRHQWWKVLTLVVGTAALVLAAGPILGGLLLLATGASFALVNVIAGLVYAIFMPLVGITTAYVYYDTLTRERLALTAPSGAALPAEI